MTKINKRVYKKRNPYAKIVKEDALYRPRVVISDKFKDPKKITVTEATEIVAKETEDESND